MHFQKWAKINFGSGKKFKTAKNAISRKKITFCISRYAFEPESKENSVEEFERLQKQIEELVPHKVSEDLELLFLGIPCLADSKTKTYWSGRKNFGNSYVCNANPTEMSKRHCPKCPNISTYKFGLGPLHVRLRTFDWLCKFAFHQDFMDWQARGDENKDLYKN